jgi:D-sedoheptulose 7-phosphate isomerase
MSSFVASQAREALELKQEVVSDPALLAYLQKACEVCRDVYMRGGKLLIAGNGGSAADAQHMAGELVSRFYFDRPALPAVALTTDTSIMTAIGNDYGFEDLFKRQIEALGNKGDAFVAISTSGNSKNILKSLVEAKRRGLSTIGFTGKSGGEMTSLCDITLKVPSTSTPRIQEIHILFAHIICAFVEKEIFAQESQRS